jgi:hypothetical protein
MTRYAYAGPRCPNCDHLLISHTAARGCEFLFTPHRAAVVFKNHQAKTGDSTQMEFCACPEAGALEEVGV